MTSTDPTSRSKSQWKDPTGKWRRSTKDLVGRSTVVWYNSKYHYHQSTLEMWHKSADTWNQSKDRCQQSAKSMLYRSVWRWNQTADQLHRVARIEDAQEHTTQGQCEEQISLSSQSPQSRFYSHRSNTSQSTKSPPIAELESPTKKAKSTKSTKSTANRSSLSPEQQIRGFHDSIVPVRSLLAQTKQARDEKRESLAEIELEWINATISDSENAADDLFAFVEPKWLYHCRTRVGSRDHQNWSRHDYQYALKKETRMLTAHQRVETVLDHLSSLQVTLEPKDGTVVATSTIASVAPASELSGAPVTPVFELPSSPPVPKIIVTQYDGDADEVSLTETPPPSYEASRMNNPQELE